MLNNSSYSAKIDLYLIINGQQFEVAGCLGNSFMLREAYPLKATAGQLVIVIDGQEKRKNILINEPTDASSPEIEFVAL